MNLAIIPARGGSKRIPNKNIKLFNEKPIIAWSIEAALQSKLFDRVIVSTDSEKIAEVARKYGAETPFIRPSELSGDYTGTIPVVRHAIEWFLKREIRPSAVCCIYATAPFIQAIDLSNGLEKLIKTGSKFTFPVTSFPFPIQRALRIGMNGQVKMFNPEHFNTRSQDLEDAYHDAGQFYWGLTSAWLEDDIIFNSNANAIILPRYRVQDIDTLEDWKTAEFLFCAINSKK